MESVDKQSNSSEFLLIAKRACIAFAMVGGTFLILTMSAGFLVSGDGDAPMFTHVMLALINMSKDWFGLSGTGVVFSASLAWAAIAGVTSFIAQVLWLIITAKIE